MMDNEAFRFACNFRLGLPLIGSSFYCSLCKKHIDSVGIHTFSCPKQRSRLLDKHDSFCREVKLLAQLAGVKAKDHHLTLFTPLDPNNKLRPDLFLPSMGKQGRGLAIDVTIGDERNDSNASTAARETGAFLAKKDRAKEQKYEDPCHQMGYSFLAASLGIFGSMTNKLDSLIRRLVEMAAERAQIPYSTLLPYWRKRLSMNIQQGNARSWMDSTVRMSGADSLQDSSLNLATHHIRSVAL